MIHDQFRLDGQVALVTGADIAGLDLSPDRDDTGQQVRALGREFHQIGMDLSNATVPALNAVVADVEARLGRLDILVNNAGIIRRAPALEFSEADWDDVVQVNLRALFFLSQAAARVMIPRRRGKIINVASMLSFQGGVLVPSYAAAKSGVAGLTRALANEWAQYGINVNAIAPGYMATDNTAPLRGDPERSESILSRIPAQRWGMPEDLKGVVVFLASGAASYVHGAIVPVDGGWLAR
jgi:2-deoxy-D-gluconate 3-dehydrogenase